MSTAALEKEIARLRAANRFLKSNLEVVKKLVSGDVSLDIEKIEKLLSQINKCSGDNYERLHISSKFLTAIAWDSYPSTAFDELVSQVHDKYPEIAKVIQEQGINFLVLSKGDTCYASGWEAQAHIEVDTEEWDASLSTSDRLLIHDGEMYDYIQDCLLEFSDTLVNEVISDLREEYDLEAQQVENLFGAKE